MENLRQNQIRFAFFIKFHITLIKMINLFFFIRIKSEGKLYEILLRLNYIPMMYKAIIIETIFFNQLNIFRNKKEHVIVVSRWHRQTLQHLSQRVPIIFCLLILCHNLLDSSGILCKHKNFVNKPVSVNELVCLFF